MPPTDREVANAGIRSLREHGRVFFAGCAVLISGVVSLTVINELFPIHFVDGVECVCGDPSWLTLWRWATPILLLTGAALVVIGAVRVRRRRDSALKAALSQERPPGSELEDPEQSHLS